jgi:thiamine-phosphate pyrophosphorylase
MATDATAGVIRAERARRLNGIYAILNESPRTIAIAVAALDAGVRILQYRAKNGASRDRLSELRVLTAQRDALLVVNDDWRAALAMGCDGVHLGPGDDGFDDPHALRESAPDLLVGLSCGTPAEVRNANAAEVDYLGVGSVYATTSKDDAGAPIGIEALTRLARLSAIPIAAIGGISAHNLPAIRGSGVAMAAVIGAIASAADPRTAAAQLVALWNATA